MLHWRRLLLRVSTIGITLVKTGLVPSKIFALGIEFTSTDQRSFLAIIALVTIYFLVAFAIYTRPTGNIGLFVF
jgi:hypothetical protein